MNIHHIRKKFIAFFEKKGHTAVPSSALVPVGDETLLFTNAGMVQFKEVFLGREKKPYKRATSSQCCIRAGGKHNDLENVGYTARHHTFFEMLGNFSFGDYFKKEAIFFAWEFLTQVLQLAPERLWITVFEEDAEAEKIWLQEVGIAKERLSRCGEKDNFWSMGDTGPCGPCTEIFYDHGPSVPGGPPGSDTADGDRYIEIWNLVFMQFNRDSDGVLHALPKPSVDTGMGLERLAAVLQGVHSNYETDLFVALIAAAAKVLGTQDLQHHSLRVLADHVRSCAFLVAEGVLPSNEERGYVLRRIMRRAIRHGAALVQTTKADTPALFFHQIVPALVSEMGEAYPVLKEKQATIERVFQEEEQQFLKTLAQGLQIFEKTVQSLAKTATLAGEVVFKLYDTYGFPVDLTVDLAREKGLEVDMPGFERAMQAQRTRARAASTFKTQTAKDYAGYPPTQFQGYTALQVEAMVLAVDEKVVVVDKTPFYVASGGQVGDTGIIRAEHGVFRVDSLEKQGEVIVHCGELLEGSLKVGDGVEVSVERVLRLATTLNHSATHLLHAALRQILGPHVLQKGSLVAPERLRFDFSHPQALTKEQLQAVETLVNQQIQNNTAIETRVMSQAAAEGAGAMALFGEKYGESVRVLTMGAGFSIELCGGTHARRTGDIGLFKIGSESSVASGVRRIEAFTGMGALSYVQAQEALLQDVAGLLKTDRLQILPRVEGLLEKQKKGDKVGAVDNDLETLQQVLLQKAYRLGQVQVIVASLENTSPAVLRSLVDILKKRLEKAVIVLAVVQAGKVSFIAGVTDNCVEKVSAHDVVNIAAHRVGGKGGGRKDMAQAGGTSLEFLAKALEDTKHFIAQKLS